MSRASKHTHMQKNIIRFFMQFRDNLMMCYIHSSNRDILSICRMNHVFMNWSVSATARCAHVWIRLSRDVIERSCGGWPVFLPGIHIQVYPQRHRCTSSDEQENPANGIYFEFGRIHIVRWFDERIHDQISKQIYTHIICDVNVSVTRYQCTEDKSMELLAFHSSAMRRFCSTSVMIMSDSKVPLRNDTNTWVLPVGEWINRLISTTSVGTTSRPNMLKYWVGTDIPD